MTLFSFDFSLNFLKFWLVAHYVHVACSFCLLDVIWEVKSVLAFLQRSGLTPVAL